MKKIVAFLENVLEFSCMFLVALLSTLVIVCVILRYAFNISFIQSEEAITMTFVFIAFLGAAYSTQKDEHVCITVLYDKMPHTVKAFLDMFSQIIIIIVEIMVLKGGLLWLDTTGDMLLQGMRLPAKFFYAVVPMSACLIIFFTVIRLFKKIYALRVNI